MSGSLASLAPDQQIEAIYIAYFGRAADGGGDVYWLNQLNNLVNGPLHWSVQQAAVNISQAFSLQVEAQANYAFLQSPPTIPVPDPANPPPSVAASIDVFLTSVYQDLFNRAPDVGGEAYWSQQILSGAVSVGTAVYDIANGAAVGSDDANVLAYKVQAADYFTSQTFAANLGTTSPLNPTLIPAAEASVVDVTDAASLAASQAATDLYIHPITPPPPPQTVNLTTGIDNLTGPAGDTLFVASVVGAAALQFGLQNTLNSGDKLTGSATGNNELDATLTPLYVPLPEADGKYLLNGYIPGTGDSDNSPFHCYTYYNASTNAYYYGVNSIFGTNYTYTTYFVRPILNNIQTFDIVNTQQPEGFFFGATVDLLQSTSVQHVSVIDSPFGDFTWLNASNLTDVTLSGSADSAIFLFPNGGPGNPNPTNKPLLVTTASITNSSSGGIVFGFADSKTGTQYGENVATLNLNVTNSPSAWYEIFGYSNDEPLGGPTTIKLNLTSSDSSTVVTRAGNTTTPTAASTQLASEAQGSSEYNNSLALTTLPSASQTQIDQDKLWLYDHALSNFTKPILATLNITSVGHTEVLIPEYTYSSKRSSDVTDRNTFLDVTALVVAGGGFANGSDKGSLDLTGGTFGSSDTAGGLYGAANNQEGFQHFRSLKTVDASAYAGNLNLNIGWADYGNYTGSGTPNSLTSIKLGSGDNHLDLISEYSNHVGGYSVTTGNGNNVILFGYNNLTSQVTLTGGTGNNTLGLTNGDELAPANTVNVTGITTLEIVGAAYVGDNKYKNDELWHASSKGLNDYNLAALPGFTKTNNDYFTAVTLTAYFNPGFDHSVADSNSSGTTGLHHGGYFGAAYVYSSTRPTITSDAIQSTGTNTDGTQADTSTVNDLAHTSTDYVIGGNVLLYNAPTELALTLTNYADDSSAHRLSTGTNGIGVAMADPSFDNGVLDLNFHNVDYTQDGAVTSKYFWQYLNQLQLDYTFTGAGPNPYPNVEVASYNTLNLDLWTDLLVAGAGAKPTAYVDEINHLQAFGLTTITVAGNATLWLDDLDQSNPLSVFDAHLSTGNIGSNWAKGSGAGAGPAGIVSISSNEPLTSAGSNLGYLDINHKFADGPGLLIETSQGLNFIQVEGTGRTDTFQLLGGNNQIWVDDHHINSSGQLDTFNFYTAGSHPDVAASVDTIPHITATELNGQITIWAAENTTGNPLTPNTGVATIFGFEADNTNNHNDKIELNGFNFTAAQNPATQNVNNVTLLIGDHTDLNSVSNLFHAGLHASGTQYGAAEYIVTNGYSSVAHPRDVFVFVDVNHDGNFTAGTDMAIQLINHHTDITLSSTNFA